MEELFDKATKLFSKQPKCIFKEIDETQKYMIIGDIHGSLESLNQALTLASRLKITHYIFLGDYIDRGKNSLECLSLILKLFITNPSRYIVLLGNHEATPGKSNSSTYFKLSLSEAEAFDRMVYHMPLAICLHHPNSFDYYIAHAGLPRYYTHENPAIYGAETYERQLKPDLLITSDSRLNCISDYYGNFMNNNIHHFIIPHESTNSNDENQFSNDENLFYTVPQIVRDTELYKRIDNTTECLTIPEFINSTYKKCSMWKERFREINKNKPKNYREINSELNELANEIQILKTNIIELLDYDKLADDYIAGEVNFKINSYFNSSSSEPSPRIDMNDNKNENSMNSMDEQNENVDDRNENLMNLVEDSKLKKSSSVDVEPDESAVDYINRLSKSQLGEFISIQDIIKDLVKRHENEQNDLLNQIMLNSTELKEKVNKLISDMYEDKFKYIHEFSYVKSQYIKSIIEYSELVDLITWSDLYIPDTQFILSMRGIPNSCDTINYVEKQMRKSKIACFIRGHQIFPTLCDGYNIATKSQLDMNKHINVNQNDLLYITLQSTNTCARVQKVNNPNLVAPYSSPKILVLDINGIDSMDLFNNFSDDMTIEEMMNSKTFTIPSVNPVINDSFLE